MLLLRTKKRFLVLFVHYLFLNKVLFYALRSFESFFFFCLQDGVYFRCETNSLMLVPAHSSFIFPNTSLSSFE